MAITEHLKLSEVLEELHYLRDENQSLKVDNDFLKRQNAACKLRCSKYAIRIREMESELADLKFTREFLTAEDAGKALAQEFLGKRDEFVEAELASEKHEEEVVGAMGSLLGDDY